MEYLFLRSLVNILWIKGYEYYLKERTQYTLVYSSWHKNNIGPKLQNPERFCHCLDESCGENVRDLKAT